MFQVFSNLGWLIRISIAFGFAAFWGYWAWQWHAMGEHGPGMPTVVGVGLLAGLAGLSGVIGFVRMVVGTAKDVKMPERASPQQDAVAASDFDADAVMERYLAQRASTGPSEPIANGDHGATTSSPSRPQFGRKQV